MIAGAAVPAIPRGVRLHHDRVRDRWVLLAPEKTIALDQIGHAILTEVDGAADFATLVATLAAKYDAPEDQIAPDVSGFLQTLAERRFVDLL